jgi:predicted nucleic acid-binding protein
MEAYLLDTNLISDVANPLSEHHSTCKSRLESVAKQDARVLIPVMAIAEIEFGLKRGGKPDSEAAQAIRQFFLEYRLHIPFDDDTVEPYALIRARLFELHGTQKGNRRSRRETLPEELKDRITGKDLGIDERDLLIVSAAIQYNCVLVTDDRNPGMVRIRETAEMLAAEGFPTRLRVENWRRGQM